MQISNFNKFGVMVDCSRNAVMTVEELKHFMTVISKMGYNQVQLYMEDTYEVEGYAQFGYLRGRYSMAELKELDDFADALGMELVPNIQTLGHMTNFLRWNQDLVDADNIMLAGCDKVYELIDAMFKSLRSCLRTQSLHIGMDEAHMLGRGKYFDLNGPRDRFDILLTHLQRVCDIADKYRFKPMMWSDMFYRIASGGGYYGTVSKFDASIREKIPENLTLVYWDYYSYDKKRYDGMFDGHFQLTDKIAFAGGAWKWTGFAPHNYFSLKATKAALKSCTQHDVKDVFMTMWGDNGAECSSYAVLPTLCYAACLAQGITKMADVKQKFYECVGVKFDDFMLLDIPNLLEKTDKIVTPCKYFLYADCFMSVFQNTEKAEYAQKYASFARKLNLAAKRAGGYGYLFDTLSKLCRVLEIKVDICTRTREAYASGDAQQLDALIRDYKKMIKYTREFYVAFRTQWYKENKPHGFDVQDARIGGLIGRMQSCLDRLVDYRSGKIDAIPELSEQIVPFADGIILYNEWAKSTSTNLYGYLY